MNLKVRFKNPVFWIQLVLTFATTVMTYAGVTASQITTWAGIWNVISAAFSNPYCLWLVAVSIWNILNDPTTAGLGDSSRAMSYVVPAK